ncbi:MAG: restriction endonuclease [Deltaproteobacteria bacterium]|nr:restriction endonuclease [Deltaproteobacteria bacterium]
MDIEQRVSEAIRYFWETRTKQKDKQGSTTGVRDYGNRGAVTGGAQINGFIALMKDLLLESGLNNAAIHKEQAVLPGYFRPTKQWDLVVVVDGHLLASIEFKSQAGPSYGNNFNNRIEEALGSATDIWKAYEKGAFNLSLAPWLGYFMLLEEEPGSTSPVAVSEPHFKAFEEFRHASYARRYQLFCERLVRERLYDATCFMMANREGGLRGEYSEPAPELGFRNFATSLMGKAIAYAKKRK